MERHLRKAQKRMKREAKRLSLKLSANKSKNKYYPSLFCTGEKIFIGVSDVKVGLGHTEYKIIPAHWQSGVARFRVGYEMDFSQIKEGDKVQCPKCKADLDFRMWLSSKRPEFYAVAKNNPN